MIELIIIYFILGFILEYLDSSLGGGYGTILTPLLLGFGYPIMMIVPMILLSEIITGSLATIFHHNYGNVEKKVLLYKLPFALIGTICGVFIALSIPKIWLKVYIGLLIITTGAIMLINWLRKIKISEKVSWKGVAVLGTIVGWNKSISGGGYGPISVAGLSLCGMNPKKSVGSTQLTEAIVCFVGLLLYLLTKSVIWNWDIAVPLIIGASLATFPSAYTTHKIPKRKFGLMVAIFIIILGLNTLRKIL